MIIVGLNAYHGDSSVCIVIDGKLIAAVGEERFTRVKHWAGGSVVMFMILYYLRSNGELFCRLKLAEN